MSKSVQLIKDHDVKWIDLRFTDTKGTMRWMKLSSKKAKCSTVPPLLAGKASKLPT